MTLTHNHIRGDRADMSTNTTAGAAPTEPAATAKRTRRAEPITKRTAKNGTVS